MKIYIKTNCSDIQSAKEDILKRHFCCDNYFIEYLPSGKPVLVCDKKQSGNISISHTDNTLVMAFADKPVGIDIERKDRKISPKIALNIVEWTRREAYGKWLGVGINKEILSADPPDNLLTTYFYGEYVISVCGEENIDTMAALIDKDAAQ